MAEAARNLLVAFERLHAYGGMSGRDMEAVAIGIEESLQDEHIRARIGQVLYLGEKIRQAGVPIVLPIGGHGIYPARALAAAIYLDSGIRAMERGMGSAGRDAITGEERRPKLELVRLTAESVCAVYEEREGIRGTRMTHEPKLLRFFQARFEPR